MTKSLFFKLLLLAACLLCLLTPVSARADALADAGEAIVACYETGSESADLSDFDLDADALSDLFEELLCSGRLPWYADSYSYTYDKLGQVLAFTPSNLDETLYDRDLYEQRVAEILKETVFSGMDQWQVALSIHDYLAAHCAYDETYTYYSAYDLLVNGTAVCQGYAIAYMDLMNRAGVPCVQVISEEMNHAWNLVQIDGCWYHVDVTWDDPLSDQHGRVLHQYLLISDVLMSDPAYEHSGWETDIACTDTRFDTDVFWQGVTSPVCYVSGNTSYIRIYDDDGAYNIYCRNEETAELTRLCGTELSYIDLGQGRLGYLGDGLSLWNNRLYYSDMEKVYSANPDGSGERVEFAAGCDAWGKVIVGCFVDRNTIFITLLDGDEQLTHIQVPTSDAGGHVHSYTASLRNATCQSRGYTLFTCPCGVSYQGDFTAQPEHSYNQGVTTREATPEQPGEITYTCTLCGDEKTEEIPPLPEEKSPLAVFWEASGIGERVLILCVCAAALLGLFSLFRKKR